MNNNLWNSNTELNTSSPAVRHTRHYFLRILLIVSVVFLAASVRAANEDLAVTAVLIWGSDEHKPNDPSYKEVDAKLAENLSKVLKWKKYYECGRNSFTVGLNQTSKVRISPKCEIELTNQGNSRAKIGLIGKGTLSKQVTQTITNDPLVLGGPDKNDTAWFVVISKTK